MELGGDVNNYAVSVDTKKTGGFEMNVCGSGETLMDKMDVRRKNQ